MGKWFRIWQTPLLYLAKKTHTAYLTKRHDSSSSLKVECRASIFDSWGNPTKDAMGSIGLPEQWVGSWIVGEIWWDNLRYPVSIGNVSWATINNPGSWTNQYSGLRGFWRLLMYETSTIHVDKYTSPMDPLGSVFCVFFLAGDEKKVEWENELLFTWSWGRFPFGLAFFLTAWKTTGPDGDETSLIPCTKGWWWVSLPAKKNAQLELENGVATKYRGSSEFVVVTTQPSLVSG